jgi:hypothetical protein
VDRTGSGSCPVAGFGVSIVETSVSAVGDLVRGLPRALHWLVHLWDAVIGFLYVFTY